MNKPAYLDNAATTPVDPRVTRAMVQHLGADGTFANPSSTTHAAGQKALAAVERARGHVASLINADPDEVIWTSGATEAINLALKGIVHSPATHSQHIVTSCLEHSAVLDSCRFLAQEGCDVTVLTPGKDGLITPELVESSLRDDTAVVSLMQVNNEVGTITDIGAIGKLTRSRGIAFHVDAAQGASRLPLDTRADRVDLVSLSAHKMYGPKGVGALYVGHRLQPSITPIIHGGDQERGLRAGTLPTHQIVAMGEAARIMRDLRDQDVRNVAALDQRMLEQIAGIQHVFLNGNPDHRVPGLINIGFPCVDSQSLLIALRDEVAMSSGSACTSTRIEPSHVLLGLGLSQDRTACSVRMSLGRFTTIDEVEFAAARIQESVAALREMSSHWSSYRKHRPNVPLSRNGHRIAA